MVLSIGITKDNLDLWKSFLENSVKFVDMYRSLLDSYVLDFFSEDLWNRIKSTWREVLIELTPSQIADFLSDKHVRQKKVWPLSLQAFRVSAFTYALPRKPVTSDASFKDYVRKHDHWLGSESGLSSCTANFQHETFPSHSSNSASSEQNLVTDNFESNLGEDLPWQKTAAVSWEDAFSELNPKTGQHKLLQHIFRRHMKPKKQHEVARLAYIAGQVARCVCNNVMVDVGSGQGHLSRFLAYGHDVRVLCIEAQDEFIRGAQKFDNQLKETVKKMNRKYENLPPLPPSPRHTLCHLEPNIDPEMFREVVTRAWPELEFCGFEHGLLGLHTCGDLGPTLLRIFTNLPSCQAVVSVGCCYMKLTVDEYVFFNSKGFFILIPFLRFTPDASVTLKRQKTSASSTLLHVHGQLFQSLL